jgi:site-specific DNA-methyltransferase (adenine-specific)
MANDAVRLGDCLQVLREVPEGSVSMVYLDPPFFTGKKHKSSTRDGETSYSFDDMWKSPEDYSNFLTDRLLACKRAMKSDASIFVHCDHNSVHLIRNILDFVFGSDNFQSEIIWFYKRWTNSKKGLLQQHQTILFYSRSSSFKWNKILVDYSPTTNVDQILQKRTRDDRQKSVYAKNDRGDVVYTGEKAGVPLGDVWEIPFLNPKAKERTGYPTQKPLLLLERIVSLSTDEGDLVLDPFCGSGTTLVAAQFLGRRYIGIDVSTDAVALSRNRLNAPVRTESALLRDGVDAYLNDDPWVESHLMGFNYSRVRRNAGADAILKEAIDGRAAFVRVQREGESLGSAIAALRKTIASKGNALGFIVSTNDDLFSSDNSDIYLLPSPALQMRQKLKQARIVDIVEKKIA